MPRRRARAALGCAVLLVASTSAAQASAQSATASEEPAAELGKPVSGKGQVVFYRPSKLLGAALSFKVRENAVELGKLRNGGYFFRDFEVGPHAFTVHSEAEDVMPIEVDAGEVYYLQLGVSVGVVAGRPNLGPSTKEAFDALAGNLKPSSWAPEADQAPHSDGTPR